MLGPSQQDVIEIPVRGHSPHEDKVSPFGCFSELWNILITKVAHETYLMNLS